MVEKVLEVLSLLGGIGMFLFGMSLLSSSLQNLAGAKLEGILERLTNNRIKGVALGAGVTAAIQSSAATSVMVLGFLNAGIMRLTQAVPVIMGANIGTTATGQILRLGDIDGSAGWLSLLKPSSFAPLFVAIGAAIMLISKKKRVKELATLLIGFGILFIGMTTMESILGQLKDLPWFQKLFTAFKNPLLGVLFGALVTALLQSSSASVGVLQAVSATGVVTFSMAAPIIMGQNIGKCITVVLASIGTNRKAKRAVLIDVMSNVIGTLVFLAVLYTVQLTVGFSFWDSAVNRGSIANFHTLFNVATTTLLLPFCSGLIALSKKIIKDDRGSKIDEELALLDDIFLSSPALALEQCKKVVLSMGQAIKENFASAVKLLDQEDDKELALLEENESFLDRTETVLVDYLVKLTARNLSAEESRLATELIHCVTDFERIGDYCENISEVGTFNRDQDIEFSGDSQREINYLSQAVQAIINMTVEAYRSEDIVVMQRVEPLEETIDNLVEIMRAHHIERLKIGRCGTQSGISFMEILTDMERMADHCSNVALHMIQRARHAESLDIHAHSEHMHDGVTEEYKALYRYYVSQYCDPIMEGYPSDVASSV
ncbi:MAG: Na/Pi cotransporter family protein [Acutalibacteraceae bacterium]